MAPGQTSYLAAEMISISDLDPVLKHCRMGFACFKSLFLAWRTSMSESPLPIFVRIRRLVRLSSGSLAL